MSSIQKTPAEIQAEAQQSSLFATDIAGPENPIHSLDIFSRGLPVKGEFLSGFRHKQTEVVFEESAMRQVLLGVDIRPTSLVMHPRAHLFPDKIEAVVFHTKSSIFDLCMGQLAELEAFNRRTLGHVYSHGIVSDVAKASQSQTLIPYGFFHGRNTLIGSEVWQVKRKDQRVEALMQYRQQKRDGTLGKALSQEELNILSPEEQLNKQRFATDFGTMSLENMSEEKQDDIINTMRYQQQRFPFINTNYYRVNYYTTNDGDFFYGDVVPDEKASMRQWVEFAWLKTSHFIKRTFGTEKNPHDVQSQSLNFTSGSLKQ